MAWCNFSVVGLKTDCPSAIQPTASRWYWLDAWRNVDDLFSLVAGSVGAGNLAGNGQSQARTLDAAAQGIVRAIKFLKYLLLAAARHAGAAIQHLDFSDVPRSQP